MLYSLVLRIRHLLYDLGWIKSTPTEIPSICVGNIGMGGTGKTPMTELIIRTIQEGNIESADSEIYGFVGSLFDTPPKSLAVISRGYKRSTKGFQQVIEKGNAVQFGDEPLQIKRKFPDVTVVVDEDRRRAADLLAHPSHVKTLKPKIQEAIVAPHFHTPDIIVLDDAFQHRRIKANKTIVLTTYNRPFFRDMPLPWGRLRDLRSRVHAADMIVVTKCPPYVSDEEKCQWAEHIGLHDFSVQTCCGVNKKGKQQKLLFATVVYDKLLPVFPDGDPRYIHSKMAVLVTGIANDSALETRLCESYRIMDHIRFSDHHNFTTADIAKIDASARLMQISIVVTTEKDAQRIVDMEDVSETLRHRMFYAPIRMQMLTDTEQNVLKDFLTF